MGRKFKCDLCNTPCEAPDEWTDEDAIKEYEENYKMPFDPSQASLVCDDCNDKILKWRKGFH